MQWEGETPGGLEKNHKKAICQTISDAGNSLCSISQSRERIGIVFIKVFILFPVSWTEKQDKKHMLGKWKTFHSLQY